MLCVAAVASGGVLQLSNVGALVGGGDDEFIFVSHLVARGRNEEIGRVLAEAARQAGAPLVPTVDRTRNRARRRWFQRNWPQHYARMAGIAAAYGCRCG